MKAKLIVAVVWLASVWLGWTWAAEVGTPPEANIGACALVSDYNDNVALGQTGVMFGLSDDEDKDTDNEVVVDDSVDHPKTEWHATGGSPLTHTGGQLSWSTPEATGGVTITIDIDDTALHADDAMVPGAATRTVTVVVPSGEWTSHMSCLHATLPGAPHYGDAYTHGAQGSANFTGITVNEDMVAGGNGCGFDAATMAVICAGNSSWFYLVPASNFMRSGSDDHKCGNNDSLTNPPCLAICTQYMRIVYGGYSTEGTGPYFATHMVMRKFHPCSPINRVYVSKSGAACPYY